MSEDEPKLKPCPFCGNGFLSIAEGSTFRWMRVECHECLARGPEVRVQTTGEGSKDQWEAAAELEAIAAWNTRQDPEGEVSYIVEGEQKQQPGNWIDANMRYSRFKTESDARENQNHYISFMERGGTGWLDFRVVKVTTIREVLNSAYMLQGEAND